MNLPRFLAARFLRPEGAFLSFVTVAAAGGIALAVAVLVIAILVFLGMTIFLIPTFDGIFKDLGAELPAAGASARRLYPAGIDGPALRCLYLS